MNNSLYLEFIPLPSVIGDPQINRDKNGLGLLDKSQNCYFYNLKDLKTNIIPETIYLETGELTITFTKAYNKKDASGMVLGFVYKAKDHFCELCIWKTLPE
jgi:hypothetical protein